MPDLIAESYSIKGVEIFEEGKHGGDEYSSEDLDSMVQAFGVVGFKPPLKLGHTPKQKLLQNDGLPAAGWIERIYRQGKKLVADFSDIPRQIYELISRKAYDRVSAEVYWNYKDDNKDLKFPRVLKAVALLGSDIPEVTSLKAISEMYASKDNEFRVVNFELHGVIMPPKEDDVEKDKVTKYIVQKRGDKWVLISRTTGDVLGTHDTEAGAIDQERAIKARQSNMSERRPRIVKGRLKDRVSTTVQSLTFSKMEFSREEAIAWAEEHNFNSDKVDETEKSYRLRQKDPGDFRPGSFRTIDPGEINHSKEGNVMGKEKETETVISEIELSLSEEKKKNEAMATKLAEMEKADKEKESRVLKLESELKAQQEQTKNEREQAQKERDQRRKEAIFNKVSGFVREKKITPAQANLLSAIMQNLPGSEYVVTFSKDGKDEEQKISGEQIVEKFVNLQGSVLLGTERTKEGLSQDDTPEAIDARIRAYCKDNSLDYNTSDGYKKALIAVQGGKPV